MSGPARIRGTGEGPPSTGRGRRRRGWRWHLSVWALLVSIALATTIVSGARPPDAGPVDLDVEPVATSAGSAVVGGTTFHAHVGAGESLDTLFPKGGRTIPTAAGSDTRFVVRDASGAVLSDCTILAADPVGTNTCDRTGLTGAAGVWSIEVIALNGAEPNWPEAGTSYFDWDITVRDGGGGELPGRVWSEKYRAWDVGTGARAVPFWVVSEHGSVYELMFNDFYGAGWVFDSNAFGPVTPGTCTPVYQSYDNTMNSGEYPGPGPDCGDPYKVFFEPPDPNLPASAPSATGEEWVLPPVTVPSVDNLAFTQADPASWAGSFAWDLVNFTGNYNLQIDANGDGDYDDPEDVIIPLSGTSGPQAYDWDGLDGTGALVDPCQHVNARVQIDQTDEIHFPLGDVESMTGVTVVQLVGNAPGESTLYWDDTGIDPTGKTSFTPIVDGTAGIDSNVPGGVHGWTGTFPVGDPWGNFATVDNWAYSPVDISDSTLLAPDCVDVVKTSDPVSGTSLDVGDTVTYTVTISNRATSPRTGEVVTDDLSGVLDDAVLASGPTLDPAAAGTVAIVDGVMTFTGDIPAGGAVTVTYAVTVLHPSDTAGDGVLVNGVVGGECPDPPVKDPTDPAFDPDCVVIHPVRATERMKTVDVEEAAPGDTVTYTVTLTNVGVADYTAEEPAQFADDMSGVLDDATFDDATASIGDPPMLDGASLVWAGPLAAGEQVVVTYTVTVNSPVSGDSVMGNVVTTPAEPECPPEDMGCRTVTPIVAPITPEPVPVTN